MGNQQDVDIDRYLLRIGRHREHREEVADAGDEAPLRLRELRVRIAHHRQAGHHPDHGLLRCRQRIDQLCQVVLDEGLAVADEERDDFLVVGRVCRGEAEIAEVVGAVDRHAPQPEGDRAVLLVGEGLRIVGLEDQLAVGDIGILFEQLMHPVVIGGVARAALTERLRVVEPDGDRLLDAFEHLPGAVGDREELVLGEVDLGRLEGGVGEDVDRAEQQDQQEDRDQAEPVAVGVLQEFHLSVPLTMLSSGRGSGD